MIRSSSLVEGRVRVVDYARIWPGAAGRLAVGPCRRPTCRRRTSRLRSGPSGRPPSPVGSADGSELHVSAIHLALDDAHQVFACSSLSFEGFHFAAKLLTSALAISSSGLRTSLSDGNSDPAVSTSSSAKAHHGQDDRRPNHFDGREVLGVAEENRGDAVRFDSRIASRSSAYDRSPPLAGTS